MSALPDVYLKKSYEAGYALFRLAGTLPERTFKAHLEDKALDLIVAALEERHAASKRTIYVAEYVLRFLSDVGAVHPETAGLVIQSLHELNAAIAESGNNVEPLPLDFLFPSKTVEKEESVLLESGKEEPAIEEVIELPDSLPNQASPVSHGSEDFNARKNKIMQKVRQAGVCRLRDLQEVLKDVSERTLRYDLQRLTLEGLIERVGNGGPATFYRLRLH